MKKKYSRRRAREIALQLLYIASVRPEEKPDEILADFPYNEALTLFRNELKQAEDEEIKKENFPFLYDFELDLTDEEREGVISLAAETFTGTLSMAEKIDDIIRMNMISRWRPERLAVIDRCIISMAIYEGLLSKKVPVNVAISEAVELAKSFGSEESGNFVNGVLARIAREYDESGE